MQLILAEHIKKIAIADYSIDYTWDDTNVAKNLDFSYAKQIVQKAEPLSLRAKLLLMAGVYEWIYLRLEPHLQHPIFSNVVNAVYCANINKLYIIDIHDFDNLPFARPDFTGPVNGAAWCAAIPCLFMDFYVSDNAVSEEDIDDPDTYMYDENTHYDINSWKKDLSFLIAIAQHILPEEKFPSFKSWIEGVTDRLIQYYIMPEEDAFTHLFGYQSDKDWLGDYVAREALDLNYPYDPNDALRLCDKFLQQVDYQNNMLLVPPEELNHKIKPPYRLVE